MAHEELHGILCEECSSKSLWLLMLLAYLIF
jgi:hypothetical protein